MDSENTINYVIINHHLDCNIGIVIPRQEQPHRNELVDKSSIITNASAIAAIAAIDDLAIVGLCYRRRYVVQHVNGALIDTERPIVTEAKCQIIHEAWTEVVG